MTPYADGRWERILWLALISSDRILPQTVARSIAAALIAPAARSPDGWARAVHRVAARHLWPSSPGLTKLPERWWHAEPVVSVTRLGVRWRLDLRDNLQRILFYTGTYEPQVVALLRRRLERGAIFVDVGAHIGVHSLVVASHLRRLGGGRVIAFEPTADSAARLRSGAAANGLDVQVEQIALGRATGELELFGDPAYDPADAGVRSSSGAGRRIATVPVIAFDQWARGADLPRMDAVKIDVEGDELAVVEGMHDSIARFRPAIIVVELKERVIRRAGADPAAVRAALSDLGYRSLGVAKFSNVVFERIDR